MKDDQVPVHEHEHAEPTVIHHPEEDLTVLARWLRHAMAQGAQFWVLLGLGVLVLFAVALISSGLVAGQSAGSDAWSELTQAKTTEDRLKIADAHPNTPVAGWAKLQAAEEEFDLGVNDLTAPGRKELAGPRLAKALKLFQEVAKDAKSPSQELGGLFGAARTLEARNELDEAIAEYKKVVDKFPDTPEGKQSLGLMKALDEPANRQFYKELYAYNPKANPNPGSESLMPGAGGIGGPGSIFTPPPNFGLPASLTTPNAGPAGIDAPPPTSPITPPTTLEPPKSETPKQDEAAKPAEAPKPEPPKTELPANPFTPPK